MASTEIQTYQVVLDASTKKAEVKVAKTAQVVKAKTKVMEDSFKSAGKGISSITSKLATFQTSALAAAGVFGIGALIKGSLDAADATAKLADSVGFSTSTLQELRFAASQTGVSQQDLDSSLQRFNRRIGEAISGNQAYEKAFRDLGVTLVDTNGKMTSQEDALRQVADRVSKLGSESEQAKALFQVFGDSGFRLVNLFKNGTPALDKFSQAARDAGIVVGDDMLRAAEEANDKLDALQKTISSQLTAALVQLSPLIVSVSETLSEAVIGLSKMASSGSSVIKTFFGFGSTEDQLVSVNAQIQKVQSQLKAMEGDGVIDSLSRKMLQGMGLYESTLKSTQQNLSELIAKRDELEAQAQAHGDNEKARSEEKFVDAEKWAEQQRTQRENEINAIMERNELLAQLDAEKNEAEISRNQERVDSLLAQENKLTNHKISTMLKIRNAEEAERKKKEEAEKKVRQLQLSGAETLTSSLMAIGKTGSRDLFNIAKRGAQATAIVKGYQAVQTAIANPPGWPFNAVQVAAAIAKTAANVSAIGATGYAVGADRVPGGPTQVGGVVHGGERVFSNKQNAIFTEFLKAIMSQQQAPPPSRGMELQVSFKEHALAEMIDLKLIEQRRFGTTNEV